MRHGNICRRSYNSARFLRPLHHYFIVFITFISFLHLCEGLSYIDCFRLLECSVLQPITAIRLIFISLPPLSPRGYLAYQSYLSSVQEGKTSVIATWATYGHQGVNSLWPLYSVECYGMLCTNIQLCLLLSLICASIPHSSTKSLWLTEFQT